MNPSYAFLDSMMERGDSEVSFASPVNPNPKLYKYRWWVFHRQSACDGPDFFNHQHSLSHAQAMQLTQSLKNLGEPYILYNQRLPRRPINGYPLWNELSDHWVRSDWAPNFDEDPDPEWQGYK